MWHTCRKYLLTFIGRASHYSDSILEEQLAMVTRDLLNPIINYPPS